MVYWLQRMALSVKGNGGSQGLCGIRKLGKSLTWSEGKEWILADVCPSGVMKLVITAPTQSEQENHISIACLKKLALLQFKVNTDKNKMLALQHLAYHATGGFCCSSCPQLLTFLLVHSSWQHHTSADIEKLSAVTSLKLPCIYTPDWSFISQNMWVVACIYKGCEHGVLHYVSVQLQKHWPKEALSRNTPCS